MRNTNWPNSRIVEAKSNGCRVLLSEVPKDTQANTNNLLIRL